ncbi:MAG TPA: hypothetical protein VFA83_08700 [Acidimicrobiales bacterium]|nr:hypothetical protein [Acidimicrobiales bacterium]
MEDLGTWVETGELAWVRLELDLLRFAPQSPRDRARYEALWLRERQLLGLEDVTV